MSIACKPKKCHKSEPFTNAYTLWETSFDIVCHDDLGNSHSCCLQNE